MEFYPSDLEGRTTNLSYPLNRKDHDDIIFKLGSHIVLFVTNGSDEYYNYARSDQLINAEIFYEEKYSDTLNKIKWSEPIKCTIEVGTYNYRMCFRNTSTQKIIYGVTYDYKVFTDDEKSKDFLQNLL